GAHPLSAPCPVPFTRPTGFQRHHLRRPPRPGGDHPCSDAGRDLYGRSGGPPRRQYPPYAKPYSTLVAPEIGLSDLSGHVTYDHYHPNSEWVYWQRTASESGENQCAGAHPYSEKWAPIYRVNIFTHQIELVAESWLLYDFPTVLSPIEPLLGKFDPFTYLVS